ncbi:MAG: ABC transporter permease [Flavobacteriales bacterium]|nr:ABC transporter permease [Flavobacteriales bacterium]
MIEFILKRLFYGFWVLFGVTTVVFILFNVLPGDPARMVLGKHADVELIKMINKDLGRDKPLPMQYIMYLNDLCPVSLHETKDEDSFIYLNEDKYEYVELFALSDSKTIVAKWPYLRRSYQTKKKVSEIIAERMPKTALLAVSSMLIATVLGIILGIIMAINKDSFIDRALLVISVLGMSLPSFFSGIIIAYVFGYVLSDLTGLNMHGNLYEIDPFEGEVLALKNLILPTLTLGMRPLAVVVQLTRNSMLEVLAMDYIRTASAKGLSKFNVIVKHALKNALNPVITTVSGWFASLMAGAIFVEFIFDWKGIGLEIVLALGKMDLPVVMGATLVFALIFVVVNILVDITYGILDPRVRIK